MHVTMRERDKECHKLFLKPELQPAAAVHFQQRKSLFFIYEAAASAELVLFH